MKVELDLLDRNVTLHIHYLISYHLSNSVTICDYVSSPFYLFILAWRKLWVQTRYLVKRGILFNRVKVKMLFGSVYECKKFFRLVFLLSLFQLIHFCCHDVTESKKTATAFRKPEPRMQPGKPVSTLNRPEYEWKKQMSKPEHLFMILICRKCIVWNILLLKIFIKTFFNRKKPHCRMTLHMVTFYWHQSWLNCYCFYYLHF